MLTFSRDIVQRAVSKSSTVKIERELKDTNGSTFLATIKPPGSAQMYDGFQIGIFNRNVERLIFRSCVPVPPDQMTSSERVNAVFSKIDEINRGVFGIKANSMRFAEDNTPGIMLSCEVVAILERDADLAELLDTLAKALFLTTGRLNSELSKRLPAR